MKTENRLILAAPVQANPDGGGIDSLFFNHLRNRKYSACNVNFGQCLIFVYLELRSILMLCEQVKMGEDGVLAEYLQEIQ